MIDSALAGLGAKEAHAVPNGGDFSCPVGAMESKGISFLSPEGDLEDSLSTAVVPRQVGNFDDAHWSPQFV